jgi:Fe-Mn family superoxide dismutase
VLPPLGYAFDALEPYIDARTMEIHHDKHHQAYVTNLNKAIAAHPELGTKTVEELIIGISTVPADIRTAVRNQGGGHLNHSLFWKMLSKGGDRAPKGKLADQLDKKFGSFDNFKAEFTKAAAGLFGSGWVWLTSSGGEVAIESLPNQDSPLLGLTAGAKPRVPLLCLDVWEHAYYLKYQNRRPEYAAAFFNVINWDYASATADKLGT